MNKFKYTLYLLMYNQNPITRSILLLSITYIITKSISTDVYAASYGYGYDVLEPPKNLPPSEVNKDILVIVFIIVGLVMLGCIIDEFNQFNPLVEEATTYVQEFELT